MIGGEAVEPASAQQVSATIADVADPYLRPSGNLLDQRDNHGRTHPQLRHFRIFANGRDLRIGILHGLLNGLFGRIDIGKGSQMRLNQW
jgi:hypothetical protein